MTTKTPDHNVTVSKSARETNSARSILHQHAPWRSTSSMCRLSARSSY